VQFRAVDAAGHEKVTSRQYWTVDTKAPALVMDTGPPQLPNKYSSKTAEISIKVADELSRYHDCDLLVKIGTTGASKTEHKLDLEVGNNVTTAESVMVTISALSDGAGTKGTDANVRLSVTGLQAKCGTCTWTGEHDVRCNHECEYEIEIIARDKIGNKSPVTKYKWTVDTSVPIATVEITEGEITKKESVLLAIDKWGDDIENEKRPATNYYFFNMKIECGDFLEAEDITKSDACSEESKNSTGLRAGEDCTFQYNFSSLLKCVQSTNCPGSTISTSRPLELELDQAKWDNQIEKQKGEKKGTSIELFFELTATDRANNTYSRRYTWNRQDNFVATFLWGPGGKPGEYNENTHEVDNTDVITMPQQTDCSSAKFANQACEETPFEVCLFAQTSASVNFEICLHDLCTGSNEGKFTADDGREGTHWKTVSNAMNFSNVIRDNTAARKHPCAVLLETERFTKPEDCGEKQDTNIFGCDPNLKTVLDSIRNANKIGDFSGVEGIFGSYTFDETVICATEDSPGEKQCDGKLLSRVKGFEDDKPSKWKWTMQDKCPEGQFPDIQEYKVLECKELPTSGALQNVMRSNANTPVEAKLDGSFVVNEGWWADLRNGRVVSGGDNPTLFQKCPFDSCHEVTLPLCINGSCVDQWTLQNTESKSLCVDIYTGPLCALCVEGYYIANGICLKCEEGNKSNFYILLIFLVICFAIGTRVYWMYDQFVEIKKAEAEDARKLKGEKNVHLQATASNWRVIKQLLEFAQILAILSESYAVPWPPRVLAATEWCRVFALDVLELFGLSCYYPVNFYSKLLLVGLFPLCTVGGIWVIFKLVKQIRLFGKGELADRKFRRFRTICTNTMLFVLINLHPIVSIQLFQIFNCHTIEVQIEKGTSDYLTSNLLPEDDETCSNLPESDNVYLCPRAYLRQDYNIQCYTTTWLSYVAFATVIAIVYTIGLPFGMYVYLRSKRGRLYHPNMLSRVGMLYEDYSQRRGMWWWETEELCRRFAITSLLVAFRNVEPNTAVGSVGAILQSGLACSISVLAHVAHTYYKPFERPLLAGVQHACLFALWAIFLGGAMFAGLEAMGKTWDESAVFQFVTCMVIGVVFIVLFGTVFSTAWIMLKPKSKNKAVKKTCPNCQGRGKIVDKTLTEQQGSARANEPEIDFGAFVQSKLHLMKGASSSRSLDRMPKLQEGGTRGEANSIDSDRRSRATTTNLGAESRAANTLKHWKTHKMSAKMKSHATATQLKRQGNTDSESMRPTHSQQDSDDSIIFHEPVVSNPMVVSGGGSGSSSNNKTKSFWDSESSRNQSSRNPSEPLPPSFSESPAIHRQASNAPYVDPRDGLDNRKKSDVDATFGMQNPMQASGLPEGRGERTLSRTLSGTSV
jgi:hypothetical protein